MFEGLDLSKMGDILKDLQVKAQEANKERANKEFTVKSGGGLIGVKFNGLGEVIDVMIDDSLLDDKESLQILMISTINDVIKTVENEKNNSIMQTMGGFMNYEELSK